jgi:hypothetical protein
MQRSAPDPDGIPYSYYRHFWKYFGEILTQTWNEGLISGKLPDSHSTGYALGKEIKT